MSKWGIQGASRGYFLFLVDLRVCVCSLIHVFTGEVFGLKNAVKEDVLAIFLFVCLFVCFLVCFTVRVNARGLTILHVIFLHCRIDKI